MPNSARLFFLVGPSGVGKDTILEHLKKNEFSDRQPLVAHRYITRPVRQNDENHIELSPADFNRRKEAGLFLFDWKSHGKQYAVGREVKRWRKSGMNVIINGSREYLQKAREIHPSLVPVWLTVSEDVMRQRLIDRGRESEIEIDARIQRNRELSVLKPDDGVFINNDQTIEDTIWQIMALIEISNI
jgi:ribose 1,5-bisphosphokinase